jgi:exopolysaccharide biosynthesis protein
MAKRTIIDEKVSYRDGRAVVERSSAKPKKHKKSKRARAKTRKKVIIAIAVILVLLVSGYLTFAFGDFYPVRELREIYIETAMTTGEHHWLATAFFPKSVIDKVMVKQTKPFEDINEADININADDSDDILGQKKLTVGGLDYTGREVLINDIEQGIVVSKVVGESYVGKIMLIDDPSRVYLGVSDRLGYKGRFILDLLAANDAIAGINASGFPDADGHGQGERADSKFRSNFEDYCSYNYTQLTFGFNTENKLVLGMIPSREWDDYNLRDCCQFGPALVVDGEQMVYESAGYGLHPRTAVGQRADGVVMFLVIDGRQIGYSIGATMGECAKIMLEYNAVSAAACDGGSSSVLAYDGELLTVPSTKSGRTTGRFLPDAWLVKRK